MIILLGLKAHDAHLLKLAHQIFGVLATFYRIPNEAIKHFNYCKNLCSETHDHERKLLMYNQLGVVLKSMKKYTSAVRCYKKMLALSWEIGKRDYEFQAYDSLGLLYFYTKDIDKARYYHERAFKGVYESEQS